MAKAKKINESNENLSAYGYKGVKIKRYDLEDVSWLLSKPIPFENRFYFIFFGFDNWSTIASNIYNINMERREKPVSSTGGYSSKRHLISPISIKLSNFLLILSGFNEDNLVSNIEFHIDKNLIAPRFQIFWPF